MPFLSVGAINLFYETYGTIGEPILLIQGVGVIGKGWMPQIKGLSAKYIMAVFDNRGVGQSTLPVGPLRIEAMARDASALILELGWDRCHVMGHSMGGVIAQQLALNQPGLVKSLILLCTVSRGADAVGISPKMLFLGLRTRIGTRTMRRRAFLELIYPANYLRTANCEKLAQELAPLFGRDLADNPPIITRQAMALRKHDCTSELPRLGSIPTLVLSATHDPIAPPTFGRKLASAIPGAKFVEIKDASHGVPIHRAAEVNRLVDGFIQGVPDRPHSPN